MDGTHAGTHAAVARQYFGDTGLPQVINAEPMVAVRIFFCLSND